jgi:hypothetical protein
MPETPETTAAAEDITADLPAEAPVVELEAVDVELGDETDTEAAPPPAAHSLASDPDDGHLED